MTGSIPKIVLCAALFTGVAGCGPQADGSGTEGTGTSAGEASSGTPTGTTPTTEGETVATTVVDTTVADTTAADTTAGETVGDTTVADTTAGDTGPGVECSLSQCLTVIEYPCESEIGGPCDDPCPELAPADCGGPDLCAPVDIKSTEENTEEYSGVETEADAICILTALRDRTPGRVRLSWGDVQGFYGDGGVSITATVDILGDGTVLMSWEWNYNTCCIETYARSQRVQLADVAFFDACLSEPDTASLIACFTEGSTVFDPAPAGWLPPWTTGSCSPALPAECP